MFSLRVACALGFAGLSCLGLGACATASDAGSAHAPSHASPEALADASAFQANYEQRLRADDQSFLTAVASHYLSPGRVLGLVHSEAGWVPSEAPSLRFEVTASGLALELGGESRELRERTLVPVDEDGRFSVMLSPQESNWRVLIHDRDARTRTDFPGIAWFPIDGAFIVEARYVPLAERSPKKLQTSRGESKTLYLAAQLEFELGGQAQRLEVFAYAPEAAEAEELLVPFRDQTTGKQSYAAGRYLEFEAPTDDRLTVDFNRATNPLCAYSEHYNCPMPPRFNRLELEIVAGAQAPAAH